MRKIYEKEWFGIEFKTFLSIDEGKIADIEFYDKFYEEFYRRFSSYDDLSENWKAGKRLVAELITKRTSFQDKLLSIGCGNGYIEYLLSKEYNRNIIAIEPSVKATRFLLKYSDINVYHGYFPECLNNDEEFDFAYMSATEYCMTDKELSILLKKIRNSKIKRFMIVSVSVYRSICKTFLKDIVKSVLASLGLWERGQFWGYARRPVEFLELFKNAGFREIESGFLKDNIYWIEGVN